MHVSLANLTIWLPCITGLMSAAFTMYVARPMPEPWIMLADILSKDDVWTDGT